MKKPRKDHVSLRNDGERILAQGVCVSNDTFKTGHNNNDLIIGPTGSGKTRYYVKPNLLNASESLVVTDTKGNLYKEMGPALRKAGYKVLLLDSCYAGMLIPVLESRGKGAEKYAVLTAAGAREEAYNGKAAQESYGWFTSAVLLGCGVQELTGERLPRVPADQNGDGAVSLREIWRFASDYLAGLSARQHPQLFLPEEDLILWVR